MYRKKSGHWGILCHKKICEDTLFDYCRVTSCGGWEDSCLNVQFWSSRLVNAEDRSRGHCRLYLAGHGSQSSYSEGRTRNGTGSFNLCVMKPVVWATIIVRKLQQRKSIFQSRKDLQRSPKRLGNYRIFLQ